MLLYTYVLDGMRLGRSFTKTALDSAIADKRVIRVVYGDYGLPVLIESQDGPDGFVSTWTLHSVNWKVLEHGND